MNWYKLSYIKSLPSMKPRQFSKFLLNRGFRFDHQSGSHQMFAHPDGRKVVLPNHPGDMKKEIMLTIIKKMMGMSVDEFQNIISNEKL
jgi:predicted RNA binding protein YcfA (HicA-like mRNA interferase family)